MAINIRKVREQAILGANNPTEDYDPRGNVRQPTQNSEEQQFGPDPSVFDSSGPTYKTETDELRGSYEPETEMSQLFKKMLNEYPERQDPSFMRRVVAGFGGLSTMGTNANNGIDIQDRILQGPNERRMSDWEKKIRPIEVASSQENQRNVNARTMAGYEMRDRTAQAKIDSAQKIADRRAEIAEERNRIARLKAEYPDWRIVARGTTIKLLNKNTGEIKDTGISTGWMDEADRIEAEGEARIEAARVTGENAANRTNQAGWVLHRYPDGTMVRENERTGEKEIYPPGSNKPDPNAKVPITEPHTIGTPKANDEPNQLEKDRVRNEKMRSLYELGTKYITTRDRGKTFTLAPRPVITKGGFYGSGYGLGKAVTAQDVAEWDRVKKELDPSYNPPATKTETVIEAPPTEKAPVGSPPIGPTRVPTNPNQLPNRPPPSNWGTSAPQSSLEQRAAEFLKKNGQAATPANIQHAIQQGWVK